MDFTIRRVAKDVLAHYSDLMDLWTYDPYHMVDDLEELLIAVKRAEKLIDEEARKVAFGNVWKESLSELSGGQRSLLALSLILSLLLFKPAPM